MPRSGVRPLPLRALGWFWVVVISALGAGGLVLQWLGPPPRPAVLAQGAAPPAPAPLAELVSPNRPGGPIPPPDPALTEPVGYVGASLPRIAPDGRRPMEAYAAGFNQHDPRPRVAVLIGDIGLSQSESLKAITLLPAPVSLAFSPYASSTTDLLEAARAAGHETLIAIPMEPAQYPLKDEGPQALLAGAPAEENESRLVWALSRIAGYAGASGALGPLFGERFAQDTAQFDTMLKELADRGLFYIDPRVGAPHPPFVWGASIAVVLDAKVGKEAIKTRLAELVTLAQSHGRALGYVGIPMPETLRQIARWSGSLAALGIVLAPVSAIVTSPPGS